MFCFRSLSVFFSLLASGSLLFILGCGGEIEEIKVQESLSPADYVYQIEPLLLSLGCEGCHANEIGGFKFNTHQGGEEAVPISSENFLYIQQSIDRINPSNSPLLKRMTPPYSDHPLYFCKNDCRYQKILTWITEVGEIDYDAITCEEPLNSTGTINVNDCSE